MSVIVRETDVFRATISPHGIRITAKPHVAPQSRVVKPRDWDYLRQLRDAEFNAACVWDYGIGVFAR